MGTSAIEINVTTNSNHDQKVVRSTLAKKHFRALVSCSACSRNALCCSSGSSKAALNVTFMYIRVVAYRFCFIQPFSVQDDAMLIHGVKQYGVGCWKVILQNYNFPSYRHAVHLKDR